MDIGQHAQSPDCCLLILCEMPDFNFPYPHWQVSTLNCLTSQEKHADSSQRPSLITSTLRKPL